VVQIIPTGANDVYVVQPPDRGPQEEILIPAITSVVLDIDVPAQRMRVELPDGLIEPATG
jgi:16S rRNA processing protein RimM